MKILRFLIAVILLFSLLTLSCLAEGDTKKLNWSFKQREPNTQPEIFGGSDLPKTHGAIYLGNENEKTVYLTFDAGYSNENVESILDTLKKHSVKGAFFILPGIIKYSPETVKRMIDEGHLVCNHSTSHKDMANITSIEDFKKELDGIERYFNETFNAEMAKFFRPPEGSFSEKTLEFCEELGYKPVFWSFAYADWDNEKQPDAEKAKIKVLNSVHNGAVILLHPTSKTNALILDDVITEMKNDGYSFGCLDEFKY